jgi:predicted Zn-dependent protease
VSTSPCALAHPGIDEQIAHVTSLIEERPREANLFLRRGELHRIHRDWKKAEADLLKARELDPELAAVDLCIGKLKLEEGKPADSKAALDLYIAKRPHDADAQAYRGRALTKLGKYVEAAESFSLAVANMPNDRPRPEYYFERAQALEAAGISHLDEALRGLDEGMRRLGDPVVLQDYAIELELKGRRYDAALARLDQLAARSQRKETWLIRRGEILEVAGRYDEARSAYQGSLKAIEILPPSRRRNRAVERLQEQALAALKRLDERESTQ